MARTTQIEIEKIGRWLDALYARSPPTALFFEPLADPEDFGVPREMQDDEVDGEGNVRWKLLPGTLKDGALARIEARVGKLPAALEGWLCARHHLFRQARTGKGHLVALPPTPSHAPLQSFEETLEAWSPLLEAKWLAFGDFDAGAGPLCLDLAARTSSGDAPVVWFDHDALFSLDVAMWRDRAAIVPLVRPLYASFEALLVDIVTTG